VWATTSGECGQQRAESVGNNEWRVWATTSGECGQQRAETQTLLLKCCALHNFHLIHGQNMRDHIMSSRISKHA